MFTNFFKYVFVLRKYAGILAIQSSNVQVSSFVCLESSLAPKKKKITVKTKYPFWGMLYTCVGCETKTGVVRILVIFQHRRMSATSMESSRRDLSNDMAEHTVGLS